MDLTDRLFEQSKVVAYTLTKGGILVQDDFSVFAQYVDYMQKATCVLPSWNSLVQGFEVDTPITNSVEDTAFCAQIISGELAQHFSRASKLANIDYQFTAISTGMVLRYADDTKGCLDDYQVFAKASGFPIPYFNMWYPWVVSHIRLYTSREAEELEELALDALQVEDTDFANECMEEAHLIRPKE